jgi:hypothetical protein
VAGRRRAVEGREGKPTRAVAKHERRVRDLADRLGQARSPGERIAAACDITRRAIRDMSSMQAEQVAAEVVELARAAIRAAKPTGGDNR